MTDRDLAAMLDEIAAEIEALGVRPQLGDGRAIVDNTLRKAGLDPSDLAQRRAFALGLLVAADTLAKPVKSLRLLAAAAITTPVAP